MEVKLKSHVLKREEKGAFGVTVGRFMLAGFGAAATYMLTNALGGWSLLLAVITGVTVVIVTSQRGGISLWQRGVYGARGRLILTAYRQPDGTAAKVSQWLNIPADQVILDGERLFAAQAETPLTQMTDWGFADGLRFVDPPSAARRGGA